MKKLLVSLSAVPLSRARPYLKNFTRHYPELFNKRGSGRKKDRIFIPVQAQDIAQSQINVKAPDEIEKYLQEMGVEIESYSLGFGLLNGKRVKISTQLEGDKELLKKFVNDPNRKSVKREAAGVMVVISRHPTILLACPLIAAGLPA